jgi:tetratricopeptide (TPR) repeat protein
MSFEFWGMDEAELLEKAFDKDDPDGRVECLGSYAAYLSQQKRHDEAVAMWQATYDEIMRVGEQDLAPDTLCQVISCFAGELTAIGEFDRALELATPAAFEAYERGLFVVASDLFVEVADAYKKSGDKRKAIMYAQRAVEAANLSNFDFGMARCNSFLAELAYDEGLMEIAVDSATVAYDKWFEMDNQHAQARALYFIGISHLGMSNFVDAEKFLLQSRALGEFLNFQGVENMTALGMGKLHAAMGDYPRALRWLKKAYKHVNNRYKEVSAEARWLAAEITAKHIDAEKGAKMQAKARALYEALKLEPPKADDKLF